MTYRAGWRRSREGAALMLVLGYLAAITLFASAFLTVLHQSMDRSRKDYYVQQCAAIAEAGAEKAVDELRRDPSGYAGEQDTPLAEGRFTVTVTATERGSAYRIVSTAALEGQEHTMGRVQVTAEVFLASGVARTTQWEQRYERSGK